MKPYLTKHLWPYLVISSAFTGLTHADNASAPRNLECTPIPNSSQSLCYKLTDTDIAPYVDWVLYIKSDTGLKVHSAETFQMTIPGSIIFSESGIYMAQEFTEEGHPHYVIYKTEEFLKGNKASTITYFSDYDLEYIVTFRDDGRLTYRANTDACQQPDTGCFRTVNLLERSDTN